MFSQTFYFHGQCVTIYRNWWLLCLQNERLLSFFKCAQIDQIICSVSGSNHSVIFIQIIIFQVHNNYQKEVTGFKLSHESFDLTLYIKMPSCHTTWYNLHKSFFEKSHFESQNRWLRIKDTACIIQVTHCQDLTTIWAKKSIGNIVLEALSVAKISKLSLICSVSNICHHHRKNRIYIM